MIRRIVAGMAVVVLAAGVAAAQGRRGNNAERQLGGSVDTLKKELGLTDEQAGDLKAVFDEIAGALKESQSKLAELVKTGRESIQEMLDEDQIEKYQKLLRNNRRRGNGAQERERGNRNNRRGGGLPPIETLKEQLELSEDQIGKIEPIYGEAREGLRSKARELREEGVEREESRKQIQEAANEYVGKVRKQLTEEQQTKFDKLMAERRSTPSEGGEEGRRRRGGVNVEAVVGKLGLDEDESKALVGKINAIREKAREVGEWARGQDEELKKLLADGAADNELQEKMDAIRAEREKRGEAIQKLREEALEGLTPTQVATLRVERALR